MDTDQRIRQAIRMAIKEKGLTTYSLADQLGIKQGSVAPLITGKRGKIPESLLELLDELDLALVVVPKSEVERYETEAAVQAERRTA